MKKYIFFAGILITALFASTNLRAQKPGSHDKKTSEIIIRKNGDKKTKTVIEINGDSVIVNGKPLSEYEGDDVSVIKRNLMRDRSRNFLFAPENDEDGNINIFENDLENDEPRTFLGVMTEKGTDGVTITNVVKGSAAEKAGLLKGDVITRLDDKKIVSPEDLMEVVRTYKPDDNVKIDYLRNNKKKDVKVKLGETKEKNRQIFLKDFKHDMNGDGFNFKMPPMPPMPQMHNLPDNYYRYNFWNKSNPRLGVKIEDTENGDGGKILSVEEGSAADKAGLKKDDVITEINGDKVNNIDEIREQLNEENAKESFQVKAKRNSTEMTFEVKIPKKRNSADL